MRNHLLRTPLIGAFVVLTLFSYLLGYGLPRSRAADEQPLIAYSQGVLQADGTVLYSVLVASGSQALGNLTITASIPTDAASAVPVVAPTNAKMITDQRSKDVIEWQIDSLDASTVLGPFTYRVKFVEGSDTAKAPPASTKATVAWQAPSAQSIEAVQRTGTLQPAAQISSFTLDPAGTLDANGDEQPLLVGDTGIRVSVPKDAVAAPVTLHFTRLTIDDQNIPQAVKDTWWCALVQIDSDAPVKLLKPILIGLPTRQILTPGMKVQLLTRNPDSRDWQPLDTAQGMAINAVGDLAVVMVTDSLPSLLAAGVSIKERQVSASPIQTVIVATGFAGKPGWTSGNGTGQGFPGIIAVPKH